MSESYQLFLCLAMIVVLGCLAGMVRGLFVALWWVRRLCVVLQDIRDEVRRQNLRWRG